MEEEKTQSCLTTKEIKKLARPEFRANPDKFYPTETLRKLGFERNLCPKCDNYYWRASEERDTCGDSNCIGSYTFINNGFKQKDAPNMTYAEAWKGFEKSLTSARVPCTSIPRYPVVARWRNDVDFTNAGIFCFQPYCTTGELDPPANPLIQPQFCVRFNDLDNIGLTGRHYSGFIMLGIQVFNYPDKYVFFKDECVEFNFNWLTQELGIPKEEITFVEDVWAGGGNLGPSIEYFVRGLELGNMVFMQYKTFPDGSREELKIKIIDTGIGLERVAWLMNGTPTSYMDTFSQAYQHLSQKLNISPNQDIWASFGVYSSQLDVDEAENIDKTWEHLSQLIGKDVSVIKEEVAPVKDMYILLDHTRTCLLTIYDGSLPSNQGGGSNIRNILRRVFAICEKHQWWDALGGLEGLIELMNLHKKDLEGIFGQFDEYKSFDHIIEVEYERWRYTDDQQQKQLKDLIKKRKGELRIDDWIIAMTTWGIPAETISNLVKKPIPNNLYMEIAEREERVAKMADVVLYDTTHLPETVNMYYQDHKLYEFTGKVLDVFENKQEKNRLNIVILDQSAFYPTSGGQLHDKGWLTLKGKKYEVVNCEKVGKSVLHYLSEDLEGDKQSFIGEEANCQVDSGRRGLLRAHHTGTHIVYAACREVLGPHVWQSGANKTPDGARIDITHFKGLTQEELLEIENQANMIINKGVNIKKGFMDKAEAEKQYGFHLYQGGIVPGNTLRVVDIEGVDTEACCGTHCDNTSEVGWVKMMKAQRISDGVVRLEYKVREKAMEKLNEEAKLLHSLQKLWGVEQGQIIQTGERFLNEHKRGKDKLSKMETQVLNLQVKCLLSSDQTIGIFESDQDSPTIYFSFLNQFAQELKAKGKGVIFLGHNFVLGLLGNPEGFDLAKLQEAVSKEGLEIKKQEKKQVSFKDNSVKKAKPVKTNDVLSFSLIGNKDFDKEVIEKWMSENNVTLMS